MTQRNRLHQFKITAVALTACCVFGTSVVNCTRKQNHDKTPANNKEKNIAILHAFVDKAAALKKKDYNPISLGSLWGECHSLAKDPVDILIENYQRHVWQTQQNNKIATLQQQKNTSKTRKEIAHLKAEEFVPDTNYTAQEKEQLAERIRDSLIVTGDLNLALAYQLGMANFEQYNEELNQIEADVIGKKDISAETYMKLQAMINEKRDEINAPRIEQTRVIDSLINNAADIISRYKGSNIGMGDNPYGLSPNSVFRQVIFSPGTRRLGP